MSAESAAHLAELDQLAWSYADQAKRLVRLAYRLVKADPSSLVAEDLLNEADSRVVQGLGFLDQALNNPNSTRANTPTVTARSYQALAEAHMGISFCRTLASR